jgi:hypothetical protein
VENNFSFIRADNNSALALFETEVRIGSTDEMQNDNNVWLKMNEQSHADGILGCSN